MQLPRGALSLLVVQLLGQTVLHECERSLFVPFLRTLVVPMHPCERKGELDQHLARNQKPARQEHQLQLELQQQQQLPRSDLHHAQKSGGVPEQIMLGTKPTPAAASSSSFVVEGEPERDGEGGPRADETSSALGEKEQGRVEGSKLSTPAESALAGRPPVPTAYAFIELDRTEDQHTAGARRAADDIGVGPALPPPLANYAEAHAQAHGGLNSIEAPPGPVLAGKDEEDGEAADSREFEAANNEENGNAPGASTLRTSSRDRQGTGSGGEGKPGAPGEGGSMLDVSSMMNLKHSLSPAERAKIHPATLEETAATANPPKGSEAGELIALCPKSANDIIEEAQKRGGSLDCLRILSHAIALPVLGALGDTRGRKKITRVATIGLMIYFSLLVIVAFSSSRGGVAEDPLLRAPQHASLDNTSHLHGLQHQQPFFSSTAAATSSTATGLLPESSLLAILFSSTNCSRVVLPLAVFLHGCFAYLCLGFAIHNILMDLSAHSVNLQIFLTTLFDICAVCCLTIARFAVAAFLARATPRPDHDDHGPGAGGAAAAGAPPGGGLLPARPVQGDSAPFGWVFVFCLVLSSLVYIWQEHFLPETSPTMVRRVSGDEDHGGEAGPILPGKKSLFSGGAAAGGAAGAGFHQDLRAPTSPPQYSAKPKDDREYHCGGEEDAAAHHRGGGSASVSSGSCLEDDEEEMRSLGAKNIFNLGDSFFDDEDEYDLLAATAASSTRLPHAMTMSPPSSSTTSASSTTPALEKYDEDDVVARRFVLDGNGSDTPSSSARRRSNKNRSAARCLGRQGKAVHFVSKFLPEKWGWLMVGTSTTPRKSSSKGISLSPDMITRPSKKPTFETSFAPPRKASPFYCSFLKGPPGRGDFVRLHDYCASMSASFLDLFRNTLRINLHLLRTSIFLRYWCVQITFYYLSESISEVIASYSIAVWKWEPGDLERMWSKLGWVNAASVCILPMFMKYYFSNAAAGAGGAGAPGGAGGQGGPANTVGQPPPRNFVPGNAAAGTYQTLSNKEGGQAELEFDYLESSSTPAQPMQTQLQPAGNINRQSVDVSQAGAEPNVYRRLSALLIFAVVVTTASNFLFAFPPGHALKNDHGYFYVVGSTIRCAFGWQSSLRFAFLTARVPVKWRASAIALIATLKNTAAAIGAWYFSNVVFDAHVLDENGWDVSTRNMEERLQHSADGNYTPKMWDAREVFRTSLLFMAVSDVFYIYALHRWR